MFGLLVLAFAILVAVLGANIRPDDSKDANLQLPEIAKLAPGSSVFIISKKLDSEKGFFAKLFLLEALVSVGLTWLALVAVFFSIIGAFYYIRVVKHVYFDNLLHNHSASSKWKTLFLESKNLHCVKDCYIFYL